MKKENNRISDFISGKKVIAGPEEIEAVQVFSKILVEDYKYPKSHIQTRPQFRVKARPSDKSGKYPVDIAVFSNKKHSDSNAYIIVECKRKTRDDGRSQLENYLQFSKAYLGVWYNGKDAPLYLQKIVKEGEVIYEEIPNIPIYKQRIKDIGKYKRKDLQKTHNLKGVFKNIRNYLAGNAIGITRDEELAKQLINLIFCKLYDEKFTKPDNMVKFRAGVGEAQKDITERITERFKQTKIQYKDVLEFSDSIDLDRNSIVYVVGMLQNYCLIETERDVVADAFEVFIGRALKGSQGQFFTPRNVVKTVIDILNPKPDEKIIDPACGSGGFLIESLRHVFNKIETDGKEYGWPESEIDAEKVAKVNENFRGIEKDSFLSKVAKAYMVILGDGRSGIFCEDSLEIPNNWKSETRSKVQLGIFDIVVTNPPFGAKIKVSGEKKLEQYELGYNWKKGRDGTWEKGKIKESEPPQNLFIDRCLDLLKDGGRLGIVLPEGTLSNPTDGYIRQSILERAEIIGLIDLPMSTFLPNTPTKTHLLFLQKKKTPSINYKMFMSYAKTCGHDKRGREIYEDEIRLIPNHLNLLKRKKKQSHLGFYKKYDEIVGGILLPKYYNPDLKIELNKYQRSGDFDLISFIDLVNEGVISISRGNEVGSENYGTGDIPFIRTSEIANWELIADATHCLSENIYNKYKDRQNIEKEDILVVNDGTYLMGRAAMVTDQDLKIVIQSHFRRIKVLDKTQISPYLILSLIGLEIVQRQIESKSFRQGTISTLGNRILEVVLPIPKKDSHIEEIVKMTKSMISKKRNIKKKLRNFKYNGRSESLMGLINKAKLGNL